jgi:hypothetical protein
MVCEVVSAAAIPLSKRGGGRADGVFQRYIFLVPGSTGR